MDTNTFYAVTAATCFTLVGLWWSVVKSKPEWLKNEATRRLAGGVYASFLIPALMSLGAQIGGSTPVIWQVIFVIAAGAGITFSSKLIQLTRAANPNGAFSKNSWAVPLLYGLVLVFALFPGLARVVGLAPLQMEALLLCLLILIAHALTWEFMTASA
ncbi:MAG: hypothetical protein ABI621_07975 [Chloroflexota bacterium]